MLAKYSLLTLCSNIYQLLMKTRLDIMTTSCIRNTYSTQDLSYHVCCIFLHVFLDPGRVPKRYDLVVVGVVVTVSKNAYGFVNTQRVVTKLRTHIRDLIPDRSTVLDFSS